MTVIVYTKQGSEIQRFNDIDSVREYHTYYELVPEGDGPRPRIYNIKNVILVYR